MISNTPLFLYLFFSLVSEGFTDPLVGGEPVGKLEKIDEFVVKSDNKYPYVVHISLYETTAGGRGEDGQCGGVLIGAQTVLTAAHCIKDMKSNPEIDITAGRLHMWLEDGQVIYVEKYKVHENYVKTCWGNNSKAHFCRNDIALLWLEKPFIFSSAIQPGVLARKYSATRKSGVILGWGLTEFKRPSPTLRRAEQKINHLLTCKRHFPQIIFDDTKLCLSSNTLTSTMCHGDSGGPFVINGVVYGIASFGRKACDPKNPSVYTNVGQYEDWIKSTIKAWSIKEFKQLKFEKSKVQAQPHHQRLFLRNP